jgi:hypothetical protein
MFNQYSHKCFFIPAQTKVTCNGRVFHISCKPPLKLTITNGVWGSSYYRGPCIPRNYKFKNRCAYHQRSIKAVQRICNGRSSCRFTVTTARFGNPCPPGFPMFMQMDYRCVRNSKPRKTPPKRRPTQQKGKGTILTAHRRSPFQTIKLWWYSTCGPKYGSVH